VDGGEQMSIHIVRPFGRHIVWLDKVFDRPVGDQPVECTIPLLGDSPIIEQVYVKAFATAIADLLWIDCYADPDDPTVPSPLEKRSVSTANIQQPAALSTLNLIQQVIVLIRLSLFKWQLGVTVVDPLGQIEQAASWKEPVNSRITVYNCIPRLYTRRLGIGRYSGTRHIHSIFTQLQNNCHFGGLKTAFWQTPFIGGSLLLLEV
jgi:hypothetical protein